MKESEKMDSQKSLGKNSIIQNSMLHMEFGIQIQHGWQFLNNCQNAIDKNLFFHLYILFFPHVLHVYSHSKMFSEKFLAFPLTKIQEIAIVSHFQLLTLNHFPVLA